MLRLVVTRHSSIIGRDPAQRSCCILYTHVFPRHQILGLEAFSESQKPVFLILWWLFLAFCGVMQGCSLPDFRRVGVRNSGTPCLASEVYMSFYSLRKVGEVEHLETTSLCCKNSVSHWPEASSPCATIGSLGSNEEVPVTLPLILRDTNDYRSHWLAWLSGGVVILDQNVPMSHRPWLMGCQVCYNGAHWANVLTYCSFVPLLTRNCLFFISVISRHCNLQHLSLQRMTTSEARSEEALAATSTNAPTEMEFLELERGGRPKSDRGEESELCSLVGVVSLLEQSLRWKGRGPLGQRAVWDDYD